MCGDWCGNGGVDFPDALSKTIPIWCAVINRLLFPERVDMHGVEPFAELVTPSEHAQMNARLGGFVDAARVSMRAKLITGSVY